MRWVHSTFVFAIIVVSSFGSLQAQKIVQLEKANSLKTFRYFVGDQITFKSTIDPDYWNTETIRDVLSQDSIILFEYGYVHIKDIIEIKTKKGRSWSKAAGNKLIQFGTSWGFYSVAGWAFAGSPIGWAALTVPLLTMGTGSIIKFLFKSKRHKIGKRKRIRLLNLNFPKKDEITADKA